MLEIGQDDAAEEDMLRAVHTCWHCGDYSELDTAWSRPMRTDGLGVVEKRAERLAGVEVPMAYDRTAVTVKEALREP